MHICFICTEIFAWGKHGGFGRATRMLGKELINRGIQVSAVVPRRGDQKPIEILDGIKVYSFKKFRILSSGNLYKTIDADIYHSEEPSFSTYLAMKAMPNKKHIVTFRDTRITSDWLTELRLPSKNWFQVISNILFEDNYLVHVAIRRADELYVASNHLIPKARKKYKLNRNPKFLATPVEMPEKTNKDGKPTVCYNARLDKRKRPEIFFKLARSFPEINFIAVGKSRNRQWGKFLKEKYGDLPNLHFAGFINIFEGSKLSTILGKSWVLVNTAAREGLPNAFIEAAAHGCAILSSVDPDGFASKFGCQVQNDDFREGLMYLLENNLWQKQGELGREFVQGIFAINVSINKHIDIYKKLTSEK